jgi:hypothetical protein
VEFVKRSNGVFGKSAPARHSSPHLLIGMLQKSQAVNLFSICTTSTAAGTSESGGSPKD